MKNPMGMLKQVQQMQAKMALAQEELESLTVEGSAGGGVVKVVATGSQKILTVTLADELAGDVEMLPDLVVAAVNDALDRSRAMAAERMQKVTAGLGLPPGLI